MKLEALLASIRRIAPEDSAIEGDPVGLLVEPSLDDVRSVVVCLDVTPYVVQVAQMEGAQLIISHHPLIYHPLKSLTKSNPIGAGVLALARQGMGIYAAHTNWDTADGGINDTLAAQIGVTDIKRLGSTPMARMGRFGVLPRALAPDVFVGEVLDKLGCKGTSGLRENIPINGALSIKTVAVCGGAGAELVDEAIKVGADAFVTADVRHHEFIDAAARGILLIDAGHEATEMPGMQKLAKILTQQFPELFIRFVPNWQHA